MAKATERGRERAKPYPWLAHYPPNIDWQAELPEKPLFDVLDEAVRTHSDHPFLNFLGSKVTYRHAGAVVERLTGAFQDLGVEKGKRVGLLLPNCPQFVFCFFSILKAGGTVVLYNPLLAPEEIARQIEDSETDFMVTIDLKQIYGKVALILAKTRLKRIVVCRLGEVLPWAKRVLFFFSGWQARATIADDKVHVRLSSMLRHSDTHRPVKIDPKKDIAAVLYTGGTTGAPKGVCLSHYNLYSNALQSRLGLPSAKVGRERVLALIPFCHAFGMTAVLNTSIALAAEILILPRFDTAETVSVIQKNRPTMFFAVPTIFSAIVNYPDVDRYDLSSLRLCTSGGDSLSRNLWQSFQRLTGSDFVQGYGLTECSPVVTSCSPEGMERIGSIGIPLPKTVIAIMSLDDNQRLLGPNQKGELCVQGPQVMMQYLKRPEATAETIRDGWLHTGDVGYFDDDGYFYLVDRLKDMIISGGYNVYPSVVEAALMENPAVREVAVVGLPDSHWGQSVTAFVVASQLKRISENELREFLKPRISSYEVPKTIRFIDKLPRSKFGKVLKAELRKTFGRA